MLGKIFIVILFGTAVIAYSAPERKIVGGNYATQGQFPFMVSLRDREMGHFCGGSILSSQWILSAAHCTVDHTPQTIWVVSSAIKLDSDPRGIIHNVTKIINYPGYVTKDYMLDISVVRVEQSFKWTSRVMPIGLNPNFIPGGEPATAIGWGYTQQSGAGPTSDNLKWMSAVTLSQEECTKKNEFEITELNLCSLAQEGTGICFGDSGGPLVVNNLQVGIASWVIPCALGFGDGWARISTGYRWIVETASYTNA